MFCTSFVDGEEEKFLLEANLPNKLNNSDGRIVSCYIRKAVQNNDGSYFSISFNIYEKNCFSISPGIHLFFGRMDGQLFSVRISPVMVSIVE